MIPATIPVIAETMSSCGDSLVIGISCRGELSIARVGERGGSGSEVFSPSHPLFCTVVLVPELLVAVRVGTDRLRGRSYRRHDAMSTRRLCLDSRYQARRTIFA